MSNDLISRSAVIDVIKRHECDTSRIMEGVMNLPIAYNVDRVIEQLEECTLIELGITKEKFEMDRGEYSSYCALSLTETKEIVKFGGIE